MQKILLKDIIKLHEQTQLRMFTNLKENGSIEVDIDRLESLIEICVENEVEVKISPIDNYTIRVNLSA